MIFGFASAQSDCVFFGSYTCSGGPLNGIVMGQEEDDDSFEYYRAVQEGETTVCSLVQQGNYTYVGSTVNVVFEITDDACVISGQDTSECSCVQSLQFTSGNECLTLTSPNGDVCTPNNVCKEFYTCPGEEVPVPDPNREPTPNGCGPSNFPLTTPSDSFLECCNEHDICYETCGNSKIQCDLDFYECMFCSCDATYDDYYEQSVCEELACSYFQAVDQFGCSSFEAGQEQACICPTLAKKTAPREAPSKFGPSNLSVREVDLVCIVPFVVDYASCPVVDDGDSTPTPSRSVASESRTPSRTPSRTSSPNNDNSSSSRTPSRSSLDDNSSSSRTPSRSSLNNNFSPSRTPSRSRLNDNSSSRTPSRSRVNQNNDDDDVFFYVDVTPTRTPSRSRSNNNNNNDDDDFYVNNDDDNDFFTLDDDDDIFSYTSFDTSSNTDDNDSFSGRSFSGFTYSVNSRSNDDDDNSTSILSCGLVLLITLLFI